MTVSKERAMQMFDRDLEMLMDDLRGMQAHYQIADWEAFVFLRKPDCPRSYVVKYAAADDEFAKRVVRLHTTPPTTPSDAAMRAAEEIDDDKQGWGYTPERDAVQHTDIDVVKDRASRFLKTRFSSTGIRSAAEAVGEYLQAPPSMWDTIERLITQRLGSPVVAATRATEELLRENFLLSDITAEEFNRVAAIITRHFAADASTPTVSDAIAAVNRLYDEWWDNDRRRCLNVVLERLRALEPKTAAATTSPETPVGGKRPRIICLCGSTRFVDTWINEYQRLSDKGNIVLTVARMPPRPNLQHDEPELKKRLDNLHLRKIDLADEVFVLNVGGYIGSSTRSEIIYAKSKGKAINYLDAAALRTQEGEEK